MGNGGSAGGSGTGGSLDELQEQSKPMEVDEDREEVLEGVIECSRSRWNLGMGYLQYMRRWLSESGVHSRCLCSLHPWQSVKLAI